MQNAAKHAGDGASLKIHVWDEDGTLSFEVVDDGGGFDLAAVGVDGHGFVNMGDRLGAINGNFTIWSAPGRGTRVGGSVAV
jgi:signal transduction histidine kinase